MALILTAAYACLSACLSSQRETQPRLDAVQNARVAMALMSTDLRAACPLDPDFEFLGTSRSLGDTAADNIDFATHNYTPRHEREGDFCEESFFVARDQETGQLSLWRRRNPALAADPLAGGTSDELATGVLGLQFEYFDGFDWYDSWGDPTGKRQTSNRVQPNISGMPEAVRITLWLDASTKAKRLAETPAETQSNEVQPVAADDSGLEATNTSIPMEFQTVVRLNLAGYSQSSSSSSDNSDQSSPGATPGGNQ
jgi:type II secretory pathway component PulJ